MFSCNSAEGEECYIFRLHSFSHIKAEELAVYWRLVLTGKEQTGITGGALLSSIMVGFRSQQLLSDPARQCLSH